MAFGITRDELNRWKTAVSRGEIAFLTHYWLDPRFPGCRTVTKVGSADVEALAQWCRANGLNPKYIHHRPPFPHFDLIGPKQLEILRKENLLHHLSRFKLDSTETRFCSGTPAPAPHAPPATDERDPRQA